MTLVLGNTQTGRLMAQGYLLAWLLLPNVAMLFVYNKMLAPLSAFLVLLPIVTLLYLYSFPSLKWFAALNIPFALCSGFYTLYIIEFHAIPYEGMWFSLWDMVYLEFFDLLRYYPEVIYISLAGFAVYLWCLLTLAGMPATPMLYRKPVFMVCLLAVCVILLAKNLFPNRFDFIDQDIGGALIQSYPLGAALQAHSTWVESRNQETVAVTSIPKLERLASPLQGREIYVLVIGETARADRWFADLEANHYENIESDNTVVFGDAYAQANFTDGSLQLMMTGASNYYESEKLATLPLILKASDCQTIWISNNKAYRYTWQADYSVVTEQTTVTPLVKRYDHTLLPPINRALRQGERRSCLIIHLLGSHFSYHQRYGHEFMLKEVDIDAYENKNSAGHVEALQNAYDNSIHATNDLLDRIIDAVEAQAATSMVMYTSDHGENIYDDERGLFQHIFLNPTRYELTVPFFVWASDRFKTEFPDKWSNLTANADRPVSNRQIVPSFIDVLGVDYDKSYLDKSLFDNYLTDSVRYVLTPDMRVLTEKDIR